MVFGITDINKMASFSINMTETLWMVELNFLKAPIDKPYFSVSNLMHTLHSFFVNDYKSVVSRVRNYKQIIRQVFLFLNAEDFTWILQILSFSSFYFLTRLSSVLFILFSNGLLLFLLFRLEQNRRLVI